MNLSDAMAFLAQNQAQMLEFTVRLAEINSGSFNLSGLQQITDILSKEVALLNCEQTLMPVAPMQMINQSGENVPIPLGKVLRCWKRPQAPVQILLVGHMDTVFGVEHKFQHVRLSSPGILSGPGVADMKGGLAVMLWGLKAFEQLPQAQNVGWEIIFNADEEVGSPGSAEIIEARAKKHQVGFVFEPAMDELGTLAAARKGSAKFTLIMHGKSAHAGRNFSEGRSAILKMMEVINKIDALNGQRDGVTINIGFIQGGGAVNVIPDTCLCRLDVRVPNNLDADWVQNNLNQIITAVNAEEGYKLELHGKFGRKPRIFTEELEKLFTLVQTVGANIDQQITWKSSGGCSDGNNMSAVGLANVDSLGVRGGNIHSPNEFLVISSLVERAQLFTQILVHLSANGFK